MKNSKETKLLIINATEHGFDWYAEKIGEHVMTNEQDKYGNWVVDGKIILDKDVVVIDGDVNDE